MHICVCVHLAVYIILCRWLLTPFPSRRPSISPSSISHCITPYIHEFPVYHENLCMKIEGGKAGKKAKKKQQEKNKQGWMLMGFLSSLGAALPRQSRPQGTYVRRPWFNLPFHFLSFTLSFYPHVCCLPSFLPIKIASPFPYSSPQLPYCLFSSRLLPHGVKASYRQRSSPS